LFNTLTSEIGESFGDSRSASTIMPFFKILGKCNNLSIDIADGGSFPFGSSCARWRNNESVADYPSRCILYSNDVWSSGIEISETIPRVRSWVSVKTENTSDSDNLVSYIGDVII